MKNYTFSREAWLSNSSLLPTGIGRRQWLPSYRKYFFKFEKWAKTRDPLISEEIVKKYQSKSPELYSFLRKLCNQPVPYIERSFYNDKKRRYERRPILNITQLEKFQEKSEYSYLKTLTKNEKHLMLWLMRKRRVFSKGLRA